MDPTRLYLRLGALGGFANATGLVLYAYYAVRVAHLSPLELVLAGTALEVATFVFEIPTGVVADLVSRRLSVVLGYLLVGAGFVLMGAAPAFWAIAGGQFVWGIGFTFFSGAREAWLADEVGEDAAGPLYPAFVRRRQFGLLVGGFVGIGIGWWWAAGTLLIGGVLYALAGVYLLFTMTEHGFAPAPREGRATWRTSFAQAAAGLRVARARPVVVTALLTTLLMGASSESFDRLWGFHLINSFDGLPDVMPEALFFGLVQLVAQLGSIAALRIAQSRTDFNSSSSVAIGLIGSNVVTIAAMILFAGAPVFAIALVGAWITFWVRAIEEPFATAWVNRGLPSATRATVLSTVGQSNALGQIAGGPIFGALAALAGVRVSMAVAAVVLVPAVALYWRHRGPAEDEAT
ncbi:MAG: MFS transporter [Dehalococcoidia bacterium]|nr:MAG: MFS transporter [Dehalococcoidia bacterium]